MSDVEVRFAWITAQVDRTEHAVSDDAQAAALEVGGWFTPLCDERFVAASMETGPLARCAVCSAFLAARASMRTLDERMNRRNWLSRLCQRRRPAGVGGEKTTRHDPVTPAGVQPSAGAGGAPESKQGLSCPAPAGAHRRRGGRHAA